MRSWLLSTVVSFFARYRPASGTCDPVLRTHRLLEYAGVAEQADRAAGVQEHHRLALRYLAPADQVHQPGHRLAGIHRIKQHTLQPRQRQYGLGHADRRLTITGADIV